MEYAYYTDVGTMDTHTATVTWGDSSQLEEVDANNGVLTGYHIYFEIGTFNAELCVTDDDGGVSCDTFSVTVEEVTRLIYIPVIVRY